MTDKNERALVLGCGGVAGAAWMAATLAEVERVLQWDARDAEIMIGTSAGGLGVALLSQGVSVARMLASQRGAREACWDHEHDWGDALPPTPALSFSAPRLLLSGNLKLAAVGLAPRGRASLASLSRLVETVQAQRSKPAHSKTWIIAVDGTSGERVAFGRADAPKLSLSRAVCASYAVPGWCPPVDEGGRSYIDGGVVSPASADLLLGTGIREVVVLAPMASRELDKPRSLAVHGERLLRRHMTSILNREVAQLERAGIRVVRIEPGPEDLRAFGSNMMDPARRTRVLETALRTAPRTVAAALTSPP